MGEGDHRLLSSYRRTQIFNNNNVPRSLIMNQHEHNKRRIAATDGKVNTAKFSPIGTDSGPGVAGPDLSPVLPILSARALFPFGCQGTSPRP